MILFLTCFSDEKAFLRMNISPTLRLLLNICTFYFPIQTAGIENIENSANFCF